MKFALKNGVSFFFFCKVIVGYKNEKGVTEDLKIKKTFNLKNDSKNSKNISRTFSGVVGSVGSVHFWIVP